MDTGEDVQVLYTTSHGVPQGLAYHHNDDGYRVLSSTLMQDTLTHQRLLLISAFLFGDIRPLPHERRYYDHHRIGRQPDVVRMPA